MPFMTVNGSELFYKVQGQGTPIVLIHPPVLTHLYFEYQMKELSKVFQVIAFDIRGHGRSSGSKQPLTYPLIVKDIECLLDQLNIQKAFICGYSTGGSIALEFLLSKAERAWGGIVISGMSEVSDWFLKNEIFLAITFAKLKALSALALTLSWANTKTKSAFWKMFKEERKGNLQNIKEYFRCSLDYNCTDKLEKIKKPTLLIYGKKDRRFYRYAKLLHDKLPLNELKWIEEIPHQIPMKAAFELNGHIRKFIDKTTKELTKQE
jgi:pimeloyl-ACP methyl ester carboxylesterase